MIDRMISQSINKDFISVCVCTFKRPELLKRALDRIISQVTEDEFIFEIIVIDNDSRRSAESIVKIYQTNKLIKMSYDCEPEQNISLARNRAIKISAGNIIAFIDDDEFPLSHWLLNLYRTKKLYQTDGVLGPVLPHFDGIPPEWLVRGKFCERTRMDTGKPLHWDETRTGNVLLSKSIFSDPTFYFDINFGRTGGGDVEFFKKAIRSGKIFIWCDEAPVYETVSPDRWTTKFYFKKYFRQGGLNGERKRKEHGKIMLFSKVAAASIIYLVLLPLSVITRYHNILKYCFKLTYNIAWFIGFMGIHMKRDR